MLQPKPGKGYDRKKSKRVLCKPLGAGGRVRGEGEYRISEAPFGTLIIIGTIIIIVKE